MTAEKFWSNVKPLIKSNGLTQSRLSELCNIPFGTFQGWIAKGVLPDVISAYKIATELDTTVEFLVTGIKPELNKSDVLSYLEKHL